MAASMLRGELVIDNSQEAALKRELVALRSANSRRTVADPRMEQRIAELTAELSRKTKGVAMKKGGAVTKLSKKQQAKVGKVMGEFKDKGLHSGKGGPVVKKRKQAVAIALSEAKKLKKK
jgi:hypothetical protein